MYNNINLDYFKSEHIRVTNSVSVSIDLTVQC